MAKQTRQQRRDRRAQQQPALAGGPPPRTPPRPTANGDSEPARKPPRSDERHIPGSGPIHFVQEAWGELKKVEWPGRSQVIQGTIVVIIACAIVGTFLYACDQFFKPFVRNVLLGQ